MANTVPYIGSRMSLISKAEIRYEGFLHEIDTSNTTVTLKNVRSFGTENRRTDKVIPPKDDIFQYIIFRGSDIKDISVCEQSAFTDPAIVQSGPPAGGNVRQPQQQSGSSGITPDAVSPTPATFPPFAMPAPPQTKPQPPAVPSPQLFREPMAVPDTQHISPEPLIDQTRSLNSVTEQGESRMNQQSRQPLQGPRPGGGYRNDRGDTRSYSATARQFNRNFSDYAPRPYAYNPSGNPYNSYGGGGQGFRGSGMGVAPPLLNANSGNNMQRPMGPRNYNNYQNNNYRWNNQNNNRRMGPRGRDEQSGPTADLKIDEEFDIDSANRKFDKSQLLKEFAGLEVSEEVEADAQVHSLADLEEGEVGEEGRQADATKFYDKSKSFFDSISCDALEKKTSRLTTAEEKKLNLQTFGAPTVNRNRGGYSHNYNSGGAFRPRSAGNFHSEGQPSNYRRNGNYYGGFNNNAGNYRRGPANSYYTSNYSGGNNNGRPQHNSFQQRHNNARAPPTAQAQA